MAKKKSYSPFLPSQKKEKQPRKKTVLIVSIAAAVLLAALVTGLLIYLNQPSATYLAQINIRDYGTVTVSLDRNAAPITVDNFVSLAKDGFYDGLTFHRIMEGFMMQGGDPDGNGGGGSGKSIKGEFPANGVDNPISHKRGVISMARSEAFDSASSQFFIVQQDSTFLDGRYAAFGYVVEGMEIVDRICSEAQPIDNNGTIPAAQQPVINSIVIQEVK